MRFSSPVLRFVPSTRHKSFNIIATTLRTRSHTIISTKKMSTTTVEQPRHTLELSVTSDTVCPFCYIGYKQINKAIDLAKAENLPIDFKLKFQPYELGPGLSKTKPMDKREMYLSKFGGSEERLKSIFEMMSKRGEEVGINFKFGGNLRNTTDSHRLLEKAYVDGGEPLQRSLVEALFAGYFEHEKDIGDPSFLSSASVSAGVFQDTASAEEFLKGDKYVVEVEEGVEKARVAGISGVPFTVVNSKYAVSGAQEPEAFLEVFKRVVNEGVKA